MGSVLVAGQSPLGAFVLRAAHAGSVPFGGATPFDCDEAADMVDVVDACDDSDELEFDRWALLRGIKAPLGLPASALHGCRLRFWGSATAVIGVESEATRRCGSGTLFLRCPSSPLQRLDGSVTTPKAVRGDSDNRQSNQELMRRGMMQWSGGAAGGKWRESRGGRMSCAGRGSPCDVRAMQALQTGAEHDSRAWRMSNMRKWPRIGRGDGRWGAFSGAGGLRRQE